MFSVIQWDNSEVEVAPFIVSTHSVGTIEAAKEISADFPYDVLEIIDESDEYVGDCFGGNFIAMVARTN